MAQVEKTALDLIRGTLDILVLKTISWQPMHGYAISGAIRQQTDNALLVEEGALYPALYRMEAKGWIAAEWRLTGNNRRAKYYKITRKGRKHLQAQMEAWQAYSVAVGKIMNATHSPFPQES
ncbi:MAG TPA: PadR family transcriptional regulator [Bryobacteraceae bacterium]|nr:PadR family transcriptional regulator [Bryobacteraceae bacterium]